MPLTHFNTFECRSNQYFVCNFWSTLQETKRVSMVLLVTFDQSYFKAPPMPPTPTTGVHWFPLVFDDFHWFSLIFHGFQWFSMVFIGFHWFSLIYICCQWIFNDFHWFSMIFKDSHWFSKVFIDFQWFSLIFIGFWKKLVPVLDGLGRPSGC